MRGASAMRVKASAKTAANSTTGSIALLAAAKRMLLGTMASRISASAGTLPGSTPPPLSAATAADGIGRSSSSAGTRSAAITPAQSSTTTNISTARRASQPPRAAISVCEMPVTTRPMTSGRMVNCSSFSHRLPTCSAAARIGAKPATPWKAVPTKKPNSSARKVSRAGTLISGKLLDAVGGCMRVRVAGGERAPHAELTQPAARPAPESPAQPRC